MRVLDADLHGQHLGGRVVFQEEREVAERGHHEARRVTVKVQLQEAVTFGQRGVGGGAGPAFQPSPHCRAVEAPGGRGAGLNACWGRRRVRR